MTDFIFLHGGGQGHWVWAETIAAIEAQSGGKARCLALDVPGCGMKRDRDVSDLSVADVVAELSHDIAGSGFEAAILVGHSQAGTLMPAIAKRQAGMLSQLAYVSCIAPSPGQAVIEATSEIHRGDSPTDVGRVMTMGEGSMEPFYRLAFCNDMSRQEADVFIAKLDRDAWPPACYAETGWRYDPVPGLRVAYVECLRDAILPPEWQRLYAARFGAQSMERIDAGHQVMNTRPQALAEALLALAGG